MRMCSEHSLISKAAAVDVKTEIFKSLVRYPALHAKPFVEVGRASDSPRIRELAEQLARHIEHGAEPRND